MRILLLCFLSNFFFYSFVVGQNDASKEVLGNSVDCNNDQECIQLGIQFRDSTNYEKAELYFQKGIELAKKNGNKKNLSKLFFLRGNNFRKSSEYEKSIAIFDEFLNFTESDQSPLLADVYSELSKAHQHSGNFEKAYQYQLNSLNIHESTRDSIQIMKGVYELGSIFFFQKNYELALEKYQETYSIAKRLKHKRYQYNSLGALGGTYSRMEQLENSIKYNLRAFKLAKKINYKIGLAYSAHNIGFDYFSAEKYDSALVYLQESYLLKKESNDIWGQTESLESIGNTYIELGKYDLAIDYLNRSLVMAKSIQSKPRILECYTTLAMAYRKNKDYKKEAAFLDKYITLNDSLVNETMVENMKEAKTQYEVQQKEVEIARKNYELSRTYAWGLMGGMVSLALLAWLIFRNYRTQKRNNKLLELKNREIQLNYKKLEANNEKLRSFAFIVSHDLKEPLRTIGSYASLVQRRYKNKLDKEGSEFLEYITDGASKLYSLLNDVLGYAKLDEKEEEMKIVDMTAIVQAASRNLESQINEKNAEIKCSNLPQFLGRENQILEVVQNLIDNAIKFNKEEIPVVQISSFKEGSNYIFVIKDNGIGFDMIYEKQIFQVFKRLNGKYDYKGSGVGLATCKKNLEQDDGKIWAKSEVGKGSSFYFSLPILEKPINKTEFKMQKEVVA